MTTPDKIRVALFGMNGHQIHAGLGEKPDGHPDAHPDARLVAVAGVPDEVIPPGLHGSYQRRESHDELIAMDDVDLIVLCSPKRCEQHEHAIRCLEAGKHVYAEKPIALHEADLDRVLAAAEKAGVVCREMAGTAFEQPWLAMRELIASGAIGQVRQVVAQKSYPLKYPTHLRPRGEEQDGGIIRQVGVHAARFVEHVAGVRIKDVRCDAGEPVDGLVLSGTMTATLKNGGVATIAVNYLNPPAFPTWGNELLRVHGDGGFCEITDGGARTRFVTNETDHGAIPVNGPAPANSPALPYHDLLFRHLRHGDPMPLTVEEELHPTRMVIRAAADAARK